MLKLVENLVIFTWIICPGSLPDIFKTLKREMGIILQNGVK
jgi:hypothetical protein